MCGPRVDSPHGRQAAFTFLQEQIEWHLRIASLLVGLAVGPLSLIGLWRKMRTRRWIRLVSRQTRSVAGPHKRPDHTRFQEFVQNLLTFRANTLSFHGRMFKKDDSSEGESLREYVSLIAQHQWALRGFILSLMPGSPDIDDVLQETNIVLWEKRKRFQDGSNFLAWATTIARFQVMRYRNIAKRYRALPFSDEFLHDLADKVVPDNPKTKLLAALDRCLEKLSEKQRRLVTARYTPGNSLEDHAATLGTSAEVLRVTLYRIRHVLKRCIEETLEGQSS
jgi:RNA polymerase sigma-70 factor (ECF subfamily)